MIINGHPTEAHSIQTEDGYILQLFKILEQNPIIENSEAKQSGTGPTGEANFPKPAVLVVHGLNSCGTTWLLDSPDKVLPRKLVAAGYSCWLACLRGSRYSRGHVTLTPGSKKYWNFSGIEKGFYDIPAIIDYILEATGNKNLYYVGHSLGCSGLFITVNMRPEYNDKVKLMISLAPAVYGRFVTNAAVKSLGTFGSFFGKYKSFYRQEVFPLTFAALGKKLCPPFRNREKMGIWLMYSIAGRLESIGNDQIEKSRRATISEYLASSTSLKTCCHIGQCLKSNQFRQYDYGRGENMKKYGQPTPPLFDLSKVTIPVVTFGAVDDRLIPAKDVIQVSKELGNLVEYREITQPNFTHADFPMGKDAGELVYDPIIQIFQKFEDCK